MKYPTDMHRHLGGSIPIKTISRLTGFSETEVYKRHTITTPISYKLFFKKFDILNSIKWNSDILYNTILDITADAKTDSARKILMSISMEKYFNNSMDISDILSVLRSAKQSAYTEIDYLLSIKYDTDLELMLKNLNHENNVNQLLDAFRGIDLVGDEHYLRFCDFSKFIPVWLESNKIVRAHVGEYGEEENIRFALDIIKANRIAHGICIRSEDLIDKALSKDIPFDICISSNYLTYNIKSIVDHPLKHMYHKNLRLTIGTDDPTVFNTTMSTELRYCKIILNKEYEAFYNKVCDEDI